jgi:hypothetical protein
VKALLFGGIAAIAAGGFYMHGPVRDPNVFNMSAADAYRTIRSTKVEPSGTGPFGRLETVVSGDGSKVVTFSASGSHASVYCTATVTPEGDKARVDASCGGGGPSSGAAAGLEANLRRHAFIELLDSRLTDRAYDVERARGATAARWPKDVVDHGNYFDAVSKANKMNAETQQMVADVDSAPSEGWKAKSGGGWGADSE